jgi:hypothetical protein
MLPFPQFSRYWKAVLDLPRQDYYSKTDLRCEQFLLFRECGLDAYYVPFHHLNSKARIVIIGVTPCWTQMERAFSIAKRGLADGLSTEALFDYIDRTGRFNGPMRWNLVEMLDGIGLQNCLGIDSCAALFRNSSHLAHFTSAVSAPVFRLDQNYAGTAPKLLKVPKLRDFVLENLASELNALPNAVIIPLGDVPGEAIQFLHSNKLIALDRCLFGFPHPSGVNVHRGTRYAQGQQRWADQLKTLFESSPRESSRGARAWGRVALSSHAAPR